MLRVIAVLVLLGLTVLSCAEDDPPPTIQQQAAQPTEQQAQQPRPSPAPEPQPEQPDPQPTVEQPQPQPQQESAQPQPPAPTSPQQQQQQQAPQQAEPPPTEAVPDGTRLIALFGDITEIVYALHAEHVLVGRDASSIYPPEAETLPNLGFAGALNAEAVLELQPTLIIGTAMAGPPEVLTQLEQAGVTVLILADYLDLDAPQIKIRIVGEALGLPQTAEALALDVEQRLAEVTAAAQTDQPLRVMHIYLRRGGLQLVSGGGNQAQAIIEAAGGIDAAADAGIVGWQPLTPEALVAANPDVYLVMDRGLEVVGGIDGLLEIPGMAETAAGRGRRVISMPDLYLLGFGPRLPEAIADLAQYLREIAAQPPPGQ